MLLFPNSEQEADARLGFLTVSDSGGLSESL